MKVVSFKVDDEVYDQLRKTDKTFREIFEPLICQYLQNKQDIDEYTEDIHSKIDFRSMSIDEVHNRVDMLISNRFGVDEL